MRIDIYIVSYNRPEYLGPLLQSLQQQHAGDYYIGGIHLLQDGPKPSRHDEDAAKIATCVDSFRSIFPDGHLHAADENIGINGNYSKLWALMASSTSDASIVFEDDLELSPHYLNVMRKLLGHAQTNPNVGFVSAVGALCAPLEYQQQRLRALVPMGTVWGLHRWGWGITRELIQEMIPIKRMYFDLADKVGFKDNGELSPNVSAPGILRKFINDMSAYQGRFNIEVDTIYDMAALNLNRLHLTTYASYARPTGTHGVHFTPEIYESLGFTNVETIDEVPDDFAWYEPEMMLDILSLTRRYYSNYSMNHNASAFGCDAPYPDINNVEVVKFLYEQILGWPITRADMLVQNLMSAPPAGQTGDPTQAVVEALATDYGPSFGLLGSGYRKTKSYTFPYGI